MPREPLRAANPAPRGGRSDLHRALRREADASNLTLSAVARLALGWGVERVQADRIAREVTA